MMIKDSWEPIHHFYMSHNTLLHNHCFYFLLGLTIVPGEIENDAHATFWGANKVYYGMYYGIDQFWSSLERRDSPGLGNPRNTIFKRFDNISTGNTKI